jgi:hypothetical protein
VLTFVCWKWKSPTTYRTIFTAEHVRVLRNMVARHYPHPHRFTCVTDDPAGLDDIETIPIWDEWANIRNPGGVHNPSCYRRLKLFAPDAGKTFGERVVSIDLDMVIVGDLTPLFHRPEDFVIWGESDYQSQWYNGSLWMLKTGTRTRVYTEFNPRSSPRDAHRAGGRGSDQGWFTYILRPREATWGREDGVYSYRKHIAQPKKSGALPDDARIVAFHGKVKQDSPESSCVPWIREHYR